MENAAEILGKVRLFEGFTPEERKAIAPLLGARTFKRDAVVLEEARSKEGLFILMKGSVFVMKRLGTQPIRIATQYPYVYG